MAIVAPVTSNSVREAALPGVRVQSSANAADFGGIRAEQMTQTGRGLEAVGADLTRTAAIIQEREDADLLFRAEAALKEKQLEFDRGLEERKGAQAWGAAKDATKFWDDSVKEVGQTLTTARQQQLFERAVTNLRVTHLDKVSRYEAGQRRASIEESAKATISASINTAAANASAWQSRPDVRDLQVSPDEYNTGEWGQRTDGSAKGTGFLGVLKRPDGNISTELSTGVEINGEEMEIPLLVPTLTRSEVDELLTLQDGEQPSEAIIGKAVDHARRRIAQGKSVFATEEDARPQDPVSIAKGDVIRRTQNVAKLNGWTPERTEYELSNNLTLLHKQVIQSLLASDPRRAREYYLYNKEEIAGADRDGIESTLKEGTVRLTAQEAGDKVMADGMTESEALTWVRQNYEGDEEAAAVTEIKTRFSEVETAQTDFKKKNSDDAWRIVAQGGGRKSIPAEVWASLDAKDQIQINEHLRTRAERAKAEAQGKDIKTDIASYYALQKQAVNDPQTFATMNLLTSPEFNKLSRSDQEGMIKLQATVAKGGAELKELQTVDKQITAAVQTFELDTQEKAIAENTIRQAIDAEAQARGKALTAEERQKVIDRMFIEGEVATGSWWRPDPNRRAYQVYGTEDASKFVPTIPRAERQKIVDALQRNGRPVTDEAIATLYRQKTGL